MGEKAAGTCQFIIDDFSRFSDLFDHFALEGKIENRAGSAQGIRQEAEVEAEMGLSGWSVEALWTLELLF